MKSFVLVLGVLMLTNAFASQTVAPKPSFEVISIKPNKSAEIRGVDQQGGRFIASGVSLKMLMTVAYRGQNLQFSGGPSWIDSDLWDVEGKAESDTVPVSKALPDLFAPDMIALMVQSLLEDRFQLKLHHEIREVPVFELTIGKNGPRIKLSEDQSPPTRQEPGASPSQRGGPVPSAANRLGTFEALAIPFPIFVRILSQRLGRTVIDKTGLKGSYDIKLQWTPDPLSGVDTSGSSAIPAGPSGPSIFAAIQEQLGLRLDSAKNSLEVIVIDSVQKPRTND